MIDMIAIFENSILLRKIKVHVLINNKFSHLQELEKKFSQTGAYKNLKKMLTTKNDQIKELRQQLRKYEDNNASDNE